MFKVVQVSILKSLLLAVFLTAVTIPHDTYAVAIKGKATYLGSKEKLSKVKSKKKVKKQKKTKQKKIFNIKVRAIKIGSLSKSFRAKDGELGGGELDPNDPNTIVCSSEGACTPVRPGSGESPPFNPDAGRPSIEDPTSPPQPEVCEGVGCPMFEFATSFVNYTTFDGDPELENDPAALQEGCTKACRSGSVISDAATGVCLANQGGAPTNTDFYGAFDGTSLGGGRFECSCASYVRCGDGNATDRSQ